MAVLTGLVLLSYSLGLEPMNYAKLWPYLLVALGFSLVGVVIGFFLSKKLSPIALNFLVGIVLIVGGALATAEVIVFAK